MPSSSQLPELWGAAEIADHLKVSRQRVSQLTADDAGNGFPAPVARLKMGKVWRADEVRRWADARSRS